MSRQKPTDGYADRLRRSLEQGPRPMSVRALGDTMAEKYKGRGLRGATYGTMRLYTDEEEPIKNPRIELLRAVAAALGIRPEWLIWNEGAMTEAEERARHQQETVLDNEPQRQNPILAVFREHLPGTGPHGGPGAAAEAMLWRLWAPLMAARQELASSIGREVPDEAALDRECADLIVKALLAPLAILDAQPPQKGQSSTPGEFHAQMMGPGLDDYVIVVAEALRVIVQRQANSARRFQSMHARRSKKSKRFGASIMEVRDDVHVVDE